MRKKTIHMRAKTLHHSIKKHITNHGGIHRGKSVGGTMLLNSIRTITTNSKSSQKLRNPLVVNRGGAILSSNPTEKTIHKISNGVKSKPIRLAL
jgi:hypothetical protein